MHIDAQKSRYFSGPLNLCRKTKQADTVMGTELNLSEDEFDALDLLVTHEGNHLTFERLYEAVWKTPDGADNSAAAREALNSLIEKVSDAGESFMRIEHSPELGYTFQTHWGHNWQSQQPQEDTFVLPSGDIVIPGEPRVHSKRLTTGLLVGACASAAVIIFVFSAVMKDISTDTFIIADENTPLGFWEIDSDSDDTPVVDDDEDEDDEMADEEDLPEE